MQDIPFRSATQLAQDIKAGRLKSRDLLETYLARIDQYNPALNAIIVQQREHAQARAHAADAALAAGENWGPLHGLPITVKESFDITGLPTTWGIPALRNNKAQRNAQCIQRLIDAGAVVVGKTNVPIELADFQSYNDIYGTTNNPWDAARSPGGSSGGAAAALAAGLTSLEMGSDIGGSIRNPAHYCGVFGHKPSWNLVPVRGHGLFDARTVTDIAVAGPLARSAVDLELALRLIAEPDELDAAGIRYELQPLEKSLAALRVAVWHTDPICPASGDVHARVEAVAQALAREGAHVDAKARPALTGARSHAVFHKLLMAAISASVQQPAFDALIARASQLADADNSEAATVVRAQTMRVRDWLHLNEARARLRWAWHDFFKEFDFMITPIMPTSAFAHDHRSFGERTIDIDSQLHPYFSQSFWAGLAGVAMLPATIIPTGPDVKGLPIGVQIIGPMFGDLKTIQLAQHLERMGFAFQAPPGYR